VLEYETAEMAEAAQQRADGLALGGSHLRVSFCAPGPPGRSMLAALIAAQATVSVQVLGGMGAPVKAPLTAVCSATFPLSSALPRPSTGVRGCCLSRTSCSS
jgi:hypothetical protein